MKKLYVSVLSATSLFMLSGCSSAKPDLIFTEIVEGLGNANAVEIYNPTEKDIDLSLYKVGVNRNGEASINYIELEGTLKSKDCYVITALTDQPEALLAKADLKTDVLAFNGNDPLTLVKGEDIVSTLGSPHSYGVKFNEDTTLVKVNPTSNLGNYSFIESDWIEYPADTYDYLGTVEHPITIEDLKVGPMLTEEALSTPFFPEGTTKDNLKTTLGTGGVMKVTVNAYGDGDTTRFNFPEELSYLELDVNENRIRYFGVDTPESGGSTGTQYQEFGDTAKNYTNDKLKNATEIHIQSVKGSYNFDTYGRILALVYVDGVLLNNMIIQMGYSETAFGGTDMMYKELDITAYMSYSNKVAVLNKKGMHGEKDPLWDYVNQCPKK